MSQPTPGWYPDPAGSQRLRWWSGGEWTEQFHDMPQQGAPVAQQMPADQTAGQYMPAQSQAPTVSSDPYNPSGVAPQLGAAGMGPQAGDAAPKSGRGWVIGAIVSVLLMVVFFGTMVYAGSSCALRISSGATCRTSATPQRSASTTSRMNSTR